MIQRYINKFKFGIVIIGYLAGVYIILSSILYGEADIYALIYVVFLLFIAILTKVKGG